MGQHSVATLLGDAAYTAALWLSEERMLLWV